MADPGMPLTGDHAHHRSAGCALLKLAVRGFGVSLPSVIH